MSDPGVAVAVSQFRFSGNASVAAETLTPLLRSFLGKSLTLSALNGAAGAVRSYYLTGSASATIAPKTLAATATAANKVYDGSPAVTPILTIAGADFVNGETVTATATGSFNSKDVLTANLVAVNSTTLADGTGGGLASNYSLASGQTSGASIMQKALTVTSTANDKLYDGNTNAAGSLTITSGLVNAESIAFGGGVGAFNSKDVSSANLVTVTSFSLIDGSNGGLASNYSAAAAHITPKVLTITAAGVNKVYDGLTGATVNLSDDRVAGDVLSTSVGAASYGGKNVGNAKEVSVNDVRLSGTDAGNYTHDTTAVTSSNITPKPLSASATAPDKAYDGSTVASPALSITSGLVDAERVSAVFNSKDVLSADRVQVQSAVLANGATGGLASNYSLAPGQIILNVHITPKALTATAAADNKAYDGNLSATARMRINGADLVGAEIVSGAGSGTFNSKDVDSANLVTVKSALLADGANGGLASNYSLLPGHSGAAQISRRASVAWIGGASGDWSSAANWENSAIPDRANVEKVIIPAGKSVTFNSAVSALNGAVRIVGLDGAGGLVAGSGSLRVASALTIGSYAQSAGEVDAGALTVANAFSETGGKLVVTGPLNITQPSSVIMLGELSAGALSLGGGASVAQSSGSKLLVADSMTLATGAGDVTLSNLNDFGKVVVASARDVTLNDINRLEVSGNVGGSLKTTSATLMLGTTRIVGNLLASASASGAISQSGTLDVGGSTIIDLGGALRLDDKKNALRGRVKATSGGDAVIASAGALAIGGDIGGKLVLTAGGPVIQSAALHVKGSSSVDAGANAVTFSEADNRFSGALAVTGSNVTLVDKGALVLGASTVTGTLAITSAGALSQSGKLNVTGASSISARGQTVTLGDSGNTFGDKLTLAAATANVTAASKLTVAADIDGALTLAAPSMLVTSANALNLHMNATAGSATVATDKALILDGNVAGALTVAAAGAITQGGALTVMGNSSITAQTAGSSPVAHSMTLANAGNDFGGVVGGSASSVTLRDKNSLTVSRLSATVKADLGAGNDLQVAAGGMVDAPVIALSLLPAAKPSGFIGSATNKFEVQANAKVTLGPDTPAVPAYFGGAGSQVTVTNSIDSLMYANELVNLFLVSGKAFNGITSDALAGVTGSISQILLATQKNADSNAELIDRGLTADLSMPIPYPHEGSLTAKALCLQGANCK